MKGILFEDLTTEADLENLISSIFYFCS